MNRIEAFKLEEDLFPRTFTKYIEKDFGILFYNEDTRDSNDSNHALIYKNKITDLGSVLNTITEFYGGKNIHPNIYQAVKDEGYFKENESITQKYG